MSHDQNHDHQHDIEDEGPHGLLAEYETSDAVLAAARRAYELGYRKMDAYSSVPVEGLAEAMGMKRNLVAPLVFIGGLGGGLTGFFMQWFASVMHYPYDIGGRPLNSWPAFIPITFELTVLGAASFATFGMLALNGLPKPYNPVFNDPNFAARASTDGYYLCLEADDPKFDPEETRALLAEFHPKSITLVDR
jgi:hypothetical protein